MAAPTATQIRDFLEGYGITKDILTDPWIEGRRDGFVIPYIERITKQKFSGVQTATEWYNGNGNSILMLNRRPIISLVDVFLVTYNDVDTRLGIGNIDVIAAEGMLKSIGVFENYPYVSIFPKGSNNIKVVYTYGYATMPNDVSEACLYLCAEQILGFIGSRTGGGNISGQDYNRTFGDRGKYTEQRSDLARQAHAILSPWMTSVVGA